MKSITKITIGIAATSMMMTSGVAFGQMGQTSMANTQVIDTAVQAMVQSKVNENFNAKVAMPTMRAKFMNDTNVVDAVAQQIIPGMKEQMMKKIMSEQMNKMSQMTVSNMKF